jgi:hypothetical protein
MYPDHVPAHIHVYDRGTRLAAWVPLSTLIPDPKRSRIPRQARADLEEVLKWAAANKQILEQKWRELRAAHG